MFGIQQNADGTYSDVLAAQFNHGDGPSGNPKSERAINTIEYRTAQWVRFLRTIQTDDIRRNIILDLCNTDAKVLALVNKTTDALILKRAREIAEKNLKDHPAQTLVEQQIHTVESATKQWEVFIRKHAVQELREEAVVQVYGQDKSLDTRIDELVETELLRRATEKAQTDDIERQTNASRNAILGLQAFGR